MSKITGSLNQQANFNRKDEPAYARKMDRTREIVKRKLDKKNKKNFGNFFSKDQKDFVIEQDLSVFCSFEF